MLSYIAILNRLDGSGFKVAFPDFPSLILTAPTLHAVRVAAIDMLTRHVQALAACGSAVPKPSTVDSVMADPANQRGTSFLIDLPKPHQGAQLP